MILLTKKTEWCEHAGRLAKIVFGDDLIWIKGDVGDPMPEIPKGDIISFLCPWILPADILEGRFAINFHPGSSNYPGTGCYNFAIQENSNVYGAVCHRMLPKVDTGEIFMEKLFSTTGKETVEQLKFRTMVIMLAMFHLIIVVLNEPYPLIHCGIGWKRKPFTHKDLRKLQTDFPDTRATRYPDAG